MRFVFFFQRLTVVSSRTDLFVFCCLCCFSLRYYVNLLPIVERKVGSSSRFFRALYSRLIHRFTCNVHLHCLSVTCNVNVNCRESRIYRIGVHHGMRKSEKNLASVLRKNVTEYHSNPHTFDGSFECDSYYVHTSFEKNFEIVSPSMFIVRRNRFQQISLFSCSCISCSHSLSLFSK